MPVLCLPLLVQSSRKPWPTHPDRIIFMPNAVQTRTPLAPTSPSTMAAVPAKTGESTTAGGQSSGAPLNASDDQGGAIGARASLQEVGEMLFGDAAQPSEAEGAGGSAEEAQKDSRRSRSPPPETVVPQPLELNGMD